MHPAEPKFLSPLSSVASWELSKNLDETCVFFVSVHLLVFAFFFCFFLAFFCIVFFFRSMFCPPPPREGAVALRVCPPPRLALRPTRTASPWASCCTRWGCLWSAAVCRRRRGPRGPSGRIPEGGGGGLAPGGHGLLQRRHPSVGARCYVGASCGNGTVAGSVVAGRCVRASRSRRFPRRGLHIVCCICDQTDPPPPLGRQKSKP